MKVFYIAFSVIQRNLRDRKALITTLLLPIVLILILGNALKSIDTFSEKSLGKTTVYYLNNDNKDISKNFDNFLKDKEIESILDVKKANNYKEGTKLVNDGKASALIYIDKDYSNNISKDKKGKINIYESKSNTVRNSIVESIIDSYNNGANTTMTASKIAHKMTQYKTKDNINENYLNIEGTSPRAIDYYAVTMLVMTLMYGATYGCIELDDMFFNNIGKRIKTTSTGAFQHLLGVMLGAVFTLILQALVLILFTKYVYGVNWGSHPFIIAATIFALSVLSTAIGVMFASIMGDSDKASGILNIIVPIFTFISGGYVKISMGNIPLINYVPNQLAHTALFNTIYGGSPSVANQSIITMFIIAISAFVIAAIAARRKIS
ncbi:ABC transporter permease [Clostridium akagii]|uniref:ABC transporter permease n=1 Tax=Clostridium akagii TaxID=91623 RepID=UPI00047DEDAB|nr:ABC transporter permease [Clostridium akagii]